MQPFNPQQHRQARQTVFMSSIENLANILAVVSAFFMTPEIYVRTIHMVVNFTSSRYGGQFNELVEVGWFICVALITFFTARATLTTAIVAAGLAAATKFV